MIENQSQGLNGPGRVGAGTKSTHHAPEPAPAIITKKWLCARLGFQYPSGRFNYVRLYSEGLTPDVIRQLGLTIEKVRNRNVRSFDRVTSVKIIEILSL